MRGVAAVQTGLEPATSASTGRHSDQLSYRTKGRSRLEATTRESPPARRVGGGSKPLLALTLARHERDLGAVDRARTGDPHLGKVMRYQLRYYRKPPSPSNANTPAGLVGVIGLRIRPLVTGSWGFMGCPRFHDIPAVPATPGSLSEPRFVLDATPRISVRTRGATPRAALLSYEPGQPCGLCRDSVPRRAER